MAPASDKIVVVSRVDAGDDIKTLQDHPAVVALFGWFGAEDKHMQKYVDLYTSKKCSVVATAAKNVDIVLNKTIPLEKLALKAAKKLASVIRSVESKFEGRSKVPVVVHAFSNGGGFLVRGLDAILKRAKERKNSNGDFKNQDDDKDLLLVAERLQGPNGALILDSAPAYIHTSAALDAIRLAIPNPFARLLANIAALAIVFFSRLYSAIAKTDTVPVAYWNTMINSTLTKREAVVYSTADSVTDAEKLAEYVEMRRKKVDSLAVLKFDDSPHVLHMRYHPAEYGALVDKMIGVCK